MPQLATPVCHPKTTIRSVPLTVDELRRLMATFHPDGKDQELRDILSIFITTGIRLGELSHLTWADFDFERRRFELTFSKAGHRRQIPFGPKLLQTLQARQARTGGFGPILGMSPDLLRHWLSFRLAKVSVGLLANCRVTPHLLRHSFAAALIATGESPISLMAIMGYRCDGAWKMHSLLGSEGIDSMMVADQEKVESELLGK